MNDKLINSVLEAGIVGAGGAGFPTHVKLGAQAGTVIINGAECEPYITSDNREFLECSESVMRGIAAVKQHLGIKRSSSALSATSLRPSTLCSAL